MIKAVIAFSSSSFFCLIFFLFFFVNQTQALYCPPQRADLLTKHQLVQNSFCPNINPNLECCYLEAKGGYLTKPGLSDTENPNLRINNTQMCCPNGYSPIATIGGGSGQCSTKDLANMPPGSYNAITDCCKQISGQTVIPEGPGVPSYLLEGGVDIKKAVPCSTVRADYQTDLCSNIPRADERSACNLCKLQNGVYTAIGCVKNTGSGIVTDIARFLVGLLGGLVLLTILSAGFRIATSRGDVKALQEARNSLTASIIGGLFVLFSMMLLQVIGVRILQLPGF